MVSWMGAMQAQDYYMARWAVGLRLPKVTDKKLQIAIDKGDILRTHLLRPTWHFVSKDDIHWMLDLTGSRIMASMKGRNRQLELTEKLFKKTNTIFRKALKDGNHLTRDELVSRIHKAKIPTDDNRASHIFAWAELEGLICSGPTVRKKQTYALLEERVPERKSLTREEALARLAQKYFSSHCPATVKDFAWWSGLSITDAKKGVESIKQALIQETIGAEKYWLASSYLQEKTKMPSVFLLPAYDEFIISYKDRTASLVIANQKKAISINGIFRPVIIADGEVTGLWKRTIKSDKVIIETEFFKPPDKSIKVLIERAAGKFGHFLDKQTEVIYPRKTIKKPHMNTDYIAVKT